MTIIESLIPSNNLFRMFQRFFEKSFIYLENYMIREVELFNQNLRSTKSGEYNECDITLMFFSLHIQ